MFNFLNSKNKEPGITVILCAYDRPHVLEEQVNAIAKVSPYTIFGYGITKVRNSN